MEARMTEQDEAREAFEKWVEQMRSPSLYDEFESWEAGWKARGAQDAARIVELEAELAAIKQQEPVRCPIGCTTECEARLHGCASECPVLPNQPPFHASPRPAIPEGWKLVPIEPTEAMQAAGCEVDCPQDGSPTPWNVYKAMLAAAPSTHGREEMNDRDIVERLSHDNPWLLITPQECKTAIESLRQQLAECQAREKQRLELMTAGRWMDAQAVQSDSTALNAAIKQAKRDDLMKIVSRFSTGYWNDAGDVLRELRRMAEKLKPSADPQ